MAITHHIIILVPLLVISTVVSAVSKPAETPAISVAAKAFTEAHNKARAMVGVSPLVWNQTLETAAYWLARYQGEVEKCEVTSFNPRKYGTNQLWTKGLALTPSLAVKAWVNEKAFYDYKSNTCTEAHVRGLQTSRVARLEGAWLCSSHVC